MPGEGRYLAGMAWVAPGVANEPWLVISAWICAFTIQALGASVEELGHRSPYLRYGFEYASGRLVAGWG